MSAPLREALNIARIAAGAKTLVDQDEALLAMPRLVEILIEALTAPPPPPCACCGSQEWWQDKSQPGVCMTDRPCPLCTPKARVI